MFPADTSHLGGVRMNIIGLRTFPSMIPKLKVTGKDVTFLTFRVIVDGTLVPVGEVWFVPCQWCMNDIEPYFKPM